MVLNIMASYAVCTAILFTRLASFVQATGTFAQIAACTATVAVPDESDPNYDGTYYLSSTDTSAWTYTYTFDYTACSNVSISAIQLWDDDAGTRTVCTTEQFTSSDILNVVCSGMTRAAMLASGDADWYMFLHYGGTTSTYGRTDQFSVAEAATTTTTTAASTTTTATASGVAARRRRSDEQLGLRLPSTINCPSHQQACPSTKGTWSCIDTRSDLYSCGACPNDIRSQDCSEIPGATNMQCFLGKCVVNACDKYHTLSQNGTACISNDY